MRADQILDQLIAQRRLWIHPGFLSRAQCQQWVQLLKRLPRERARSEEFGNAPETAPRQSNLIQAPAQALEAMKAGLLPLAPVLENHFRVPLTRSEQLNFLHYGLGDQFKIHSDWSDAPVYRDRQVSLILPLNDNGADLGPTYSGGVLHFFVPQPDSPGQLMGVPVPAPAGMLLAFRSDLPHAVSPVTAGDRFSLVTWLAR